LNRAAENAVGVLRRTLGRAASVRWRRLPPYDEKAPPPQLLRKAITLNDRKYNSHLPLNEITSQLLQQLKRWMSDAAQHNDLTFGLMKAG
jgi:hypothetical protein